ncbi:MAG: DUF488 domain-containing protein [Alphaproteobacteria bacterium]|nr:MAG: DUF488 domain-containing protein [Alphaproteobacteria bacterium]
MPAIFTRRIYDPPAAQDGYRVLVDRLWPRGMTKEKAAIDHWAKDLAPSTDLRRWFHAHPEGWDEFAARYRAELAGKEDALRRLRAAAGTRPLTLLYSVRDPARNHAVILGSVLETFTP